MKLPVIHVSEVASEVEPVNSGVDVEAELGSIESAFEMEAEKPVVLVIDDNRDIQKLVGELLAADYNVVVASNGAEGVKRP